MKDTETIRERITVWCTQALVIASVLLSVIGFTAEGKGLGQGAVLTFILILFAWLLTESVEKFIFLKNQQNMWRAGVMVPLMVLLLGVEVHLVHFGIGWLFPEFPEILHYAVGGGFSLFMLFAKATYGFTPKPELESTSATGELATTLEVAAGLLGDGMKAPNLHLVGEPSIELATAN